MYYAGVVIRFAGTMSVAHVFCLAPLINKQGFNRRIIYKAITVQATRTNKLPRFVRPRANSTLSSACAGAIRIVGMDSIQRPGDGRPAAVPYI